MKTYLYLSLLPEALIASMLPPEEFGCYYAVGTKKRSRGEAIFFEVDPSFRSGVFPFDSLAARCVPHPDGQPKRSVYLSVYRVLEHVPLSALGNLHLVTDDGKVLELRRGAATPAEEPGLHLYQELCPVTPLIASLLKPLDFARLITDPAQPVSLPRLIFVDLLLGELALSPSSGSAEDLPYSNLGHLRDCLVGLQANPDKPTKTIVRHMRRDLLYRTIKTGVYAADRDHLVHYPMPTRKELENRHYAWWRSALTVGFEL